ncbi:hypothetical protein [Bordetella flabilis]|uniref:Uncharacterized protein n=1 Tax=Bordetella flabilis TaxID=463014 RepID=A0A193GLR7_9BORD|nr:hypothetical protein [Bordetella flabilis]ANN80815.1 hypothetical protein BAU07_26160 [Bordetella flabilis]
MSNADSLAAIEGFLRSKCSYKRLLELDALILRKDMGPTHDDVIRSFVQKAIEEVTKNERET